MMYNAEIKVTGILKMEINAKNMEEAKIKAIMAFHAADLGELIDTDAKVIKIEDDDSVFYY